MVHYNFKSICIVPNASDFIDIVLSKTQRKTPTVVHKRYRISSIRQFYMRKVKYCSTVIKERITQLLTAFPRVDNIHPFYADLIHVLYDKDHYKLALGQLNATKNAVDQISKEYVRLLKYGDSLYRCKQLKKAALGRMCTFLKKQDVALKYLEEVRQHLSRLPSIDPSTRTLIITGYPNVGKSSFINKVSRAEVDVQPYAFTTKSLFVGHFYEKYVKWQIIDTPGILDHPLQMLDGCNNIEMQAITAIAHIESCILFFIDLSPLCEYTIEKQLHLFEFLRPIFIEKPILFVASKCDLRKLEELDPKEAEKIKTAAEKYSIDIIELSNKSEEGITKVRKKACDLLLSKRVESKINSKKAIDVKNRLSITVPVLRDKRQRLPSIPKSVIKQRLDEKMGVEVPSKEKTTKQIQNENGGPGVFNFDLRSHWDLKDPSQAHDKIPEIYKGQNIVDWIDPEIEKKLDALEKEEKEIVEQMVDEESEGMNEDEQELFDEIVSRKDEIVFRSKLKSTPNKPIISRPKKTRSIREMTRSLSRIGLDPSKLKERLRSRSRARSNSRKNDISSLNRRNSRSRERSLSIVPPKRPIGYKSEKQKDKAKKVVDKMIRKMGRKARSGPGDNRILATRPKHLFSGKRKMGKTNWR